MPTITSTTQLTETNIDLSSNNTSVTSEISSTIFETMTIIPSDFNTTAITMINASEQFSTDDNENIVSIMESTIATTLSSIDTDMSTTTTTTTGRTTTTTMTPPNLLINPDAELGSLVGWNQTGSSPVMIDSNGQFNENYYPHSGTFCFVGGEGPGSPSRLVQNVKLLGGVQGKIHSLKLMSKCVDSLLPTPSLPPPSPLVANNDGVDESINV
ncbi:unnamed protein product [Rotaria sp. Silwood1]|nr:unnamed protein product [Rotaria sp. Silwood1]